MVAADKNIQGGIMSYSVSKNSTVNISGIQEGVTATVTVASSTSFKIKVNNTCVGTVEKLIFSPGQTLTLENGTYSTSCTYDDLNCGKYTVPVTLSLSNGKLSCTVGTVTNTYKKSFITADVEGTLVFDIEQVQAYTLTINSVSNGSVKVMRNNLELSNGAVLSEGDELTVSATASGADYGVQSIVVNGTLYSGASKTFTVSGNATVSAVIVQRSWQTFFNDSATMSHGDRLNISGLKPGVSTRFTTGIGTITYGLLDGCDYDQGTGEFTINARTAVVGGDGSISGSNNRDGVDFGFTLTAENGGLRFNAYVEGSDSMYYYYFIGASIPVYKVEQYVV